MLSDRTSIQKVERQGDRKRKWIQTRASIGEKSTFGCQFSSSQAGRGDWTQRSGKKLGAGDALKLQGSTTVALKASFRSSRASPATRPAITTAVVADHATVPVPAGGGDEGVHVGPGPERGHDELLDAGLYREGAQPQRRRPPSPPAIS